MAGDLWWKKRGEYKQPKGTVTCERMNNYVWPCQIENMDVLIGRNRDAVEKLMGH
jgi:hypothetical protein